MTNLTTTEARLVEQYVASWTTCRAAPGIDHGDWFYLYDKAAPSPSTPSGWPGRPRGPRRPPPPPHRGGAGRGGLVRPPLPAARLLIPSTRGAAMIARPPRRPAPGGGLAVLVVVTVLAALAAPTPRRSAAWSPAGSRPSPPHAPRSPAGLPAAIGADLHQRRWLPARRRLPLPAAGPPGPPVLVAAAAAPIRVSCLRSGHSWYVKGTRRVSNHSVWRASTSTRSTAARSAPRTPPPAGWRCGSARAGPGSSRARSAPPGPSAAGPGSPTPATRGICMSALPARPGRCPVIAVGLAGRWGARHHRPGLSAGPGRDRLRRRPRPGPDRPARPGQARPAPPQAGRRVPAEADPGRRRRHPRSYLRLYCQAGARYRVPWAVLAAIGKVESDHGRARLPGCGRAATGPGRAGPCRSAVSQEQGRQRLGPLRPRPPPRPGQRHPGRGPVSGRPRRPPRSRPGHVRLQPLPGLRGQGQAARPPLRPEAVGGR